MPFSLYLPRYDSQAISDSDDEDDALEEDPMGLADKENGWQAPRIGATRQSVDVNDVRPDDFLIVRATNVDEDSFTVGDIGTPLWLCKVNSTVNETEMVSGFRTWFHARKGR